MEARAVKIGNSLAFRIPKTIADRCGLVESSSVDITLRGEEIIIKPIRKRYQLADLLAGITPENLHAEVGRGGPMGQELI